MKNTMHKNLKRTSNLGSFQKNTFINPSNDKPLQILTKHFKFFLKTTKQKIKFEPRMKSNG